MKRRPFVAMAFALRLVRSSSSSISSKYLASNTKFVAAQLIQSGERDVGRVMRRGVDLAWAAIMLPLAAPAFFLVLLSYAQGKKPLDTQLCWGRQRCTFRRYQLDGDQIYGGGILHRIGLGNLVGILLNIVLGDLTLVGPRPLSTSEPIASQHSLDRRCRVAPGLVCLWWLRHRASIDCGDERHADLEYIENRGLIQDAGILFRSLASLLYGHSIVESGKSSINGIRFDNVSMSEAINQIRESLNHRGLSRVAFINADCMNLASRNPEYGSALQSADMVFADGIGVKIAGRMIGCPVKENVNGTDLFPKLCRSIASTETGVFLLGGRPGIPERVRDWIQEHEPNARVCGVHHGYFDSSDQAEVIRKIEESGAVLVLVAFGAPKQDLWIRDALAGTRVRVAIGVGGLFDFYSGRIPRAPLWMREAGLEWAFRLYQEPGRLWRRYVIGNFTFLARTMFYRMKHGLAGSRTTQIPMLETPE